MDFSKVRLGVVFLIVFSDRHVEGMNRDVQTRNETVDVVCDQVDEHVEGGSGISGRFLADSLFNHVESEVATDAFQSEHAVHGSHNFNVSGVLHLGQVHQTGFDSVSLSVSHSQVLHVVGDFTHHNLVFRLALLIKSTHASHKTSEQSLLSESQ